MRERDIFRNIQHIPKVWGITYIHLFLSLGIGFLFITLGFVFVSKAGVIAKVGTIIVGIVLSGISYGFWWWRDNIDGLATDSAPWMKCVLNSQSLSSQQIKFTQGEKNAEVQ